MTLDNNAPLSKKQIEFVKKANAKINLAHGSVRSGKTVCTLFKFFLEVAKCPDSKIWMIGKTSETIYDNAIRLVLEADPARNDPLCVFKPYCTWLGGTKRELKFLDKTISVLGAQNEGAMGAIQGKTFSLCYCDEMTLYPDSIIDMINTRLSEPHSKLFASMNPSHPTHKCKQWIDAAEAGDPQYYSLQFLLSDNPYVDEEYKSRVQKSLNGLFYKRNFLGLWCAADGAIFDFFDRQYHTRPFERRGGAEYWIAGMDVGTTNAFACVLIGVSTGRSTQTGRSWWVEKEYYWDSKKEERQKTYSEYAADLIDFFDGYDVKAVYIDPSAAAMKAQLRASNIHCTDANNDVLGGIQIVANELRDGNFYVCQNCPNLIREIEGYVWDTKAAERGWDEPKKVNDHAIDATRYALASHKVPKLYATNKDFGRTLGYKR